MRWPGIVVVALLAAGAARAAGPFGITGFAIPGGGTEAAAWRHDGRQVVTVAPSDTLLFWDAASHRLIDTMALAGLPQRSADWQATRRVTLRLSPDGALAAVTVVPSDAPPATMLVDLVAQKVTATLDRPVLFWTGAGLVAGPRAGCTAACDFATVDPRTAAATPVGTGFGDGRVVAASPDGSRFATVVGAGSGPALVVWSTATWTVVARAPLPAGAVVEVGFDHAGTRAFARQDGHVVVLDLAGGATMTAALSPQAGEPGATTDLDRRQVMTTVGPLPFDSDLMVARVGFFRFYTADQHYGAIYDYNDGLARAIGGLPAKPNTVPWQVELQYRAPPGSGLSPAVLHNCGGSLIRPGWVLTATHCFLTADNVLRSDDEAKAHTLVRAGSTELDGDMAVFDVADVYIRRCTGGSHDCFHDYDPAARPPVPPVDDITLLRIVPHVEPAVVRSYSLREIQPGKIAPISLPSADAEVPPTTPVTMTGWGATSAADAQERVMSASLNRIDIAVMSRETCSTRHGFGTLPPTLICAGSGNDAQLACKGDSGGPLVADMYRKARRAGGPPVAWKPVLVGIVSWGSCAGGPAIYTRVAAFVPWIDATIAAAEARR